MTIHVINVPDIGEGIAEVEIVEWPISVGQTVEEDDVICVVMTDKATVEIPSPVDGVITWLGAEAGEMVAVGAELIKLEVESGNISVEENSVVDEPAVLVEPVITTSVAPTTAKIPEVEQPPVSIINRPVASPAVRRRAKENSVDLRQVQGTGPTARISHEDLNEFMNKSANKQSNASTTEVVARAPSAANTAVQEIKVIGLRRKIATIMQDTMQRIPHFTYVEEIDVTELERLRAKLNKNRNEKQPKLTILPFVIKALVNSIKVFPEMSSRYDDEANIVHRFGAAHVGIATQTDNGLVVPVVKHAEALDIWGAAAEVKRLATVCRNGTAKSDELSGSTITITSLGPMGGIVTTPVINSPEVAIVGINKIAKRPVWQDGVFIPRDIMNISASFDHRIIDGWEATQFIQHIKSLIETPALLFMND